MSLLQGRNAILTGASRGLGSHIARALWRNGAGLMLVARSVHALESLEQDLMEGAHAGQRMHKLGVDLRSHDAPQLIMDEWARHFDRLDVLINNAGMIGPIGRAWENDWQEWQDTLSVNLLAPVALCRASIPLMKENGGGRILNISGGGATGTRPHFSAYAVAKTGLVRFTEILADEVKDMNIQVNSIAPGALNTDMLRTVLDAGPEKAGHLEYTAVRKLMETGGNDPGLAAELCVFLASSASDGISGKLISAVWDPWRELPKHLDDLNRTDVYTLRRIIPRERGKDWG